jgi:hypothetical protein
MRCNWNSRFVSRREFIACGAVMSGASGTKALASLAKDEESPVRLEGTASRPNGFRKLRGTIAAIITPLSGAGPDHARLLSLAHHLLDSGCDGLNLLGTTGEATSLSVDERLGLMAAVAGSNLPKERLMVGTGAAALSDAVKLSKGATELGFSGLLLLPPFYYKNVTESGIIAYVSQIVEATAASSASIYLYNYPALSGVTYTLPMIAELLRRHGTRIAGLKDSSGDFAYARAATKLSKTFDVFPFGSSVWGLCRVHFGDSQCHLRRVRQSVSTWGRSCAPSCSRNSSGLRGSSTSPCSKIHSLEGSPRS